MRYLETELTMNQAGGSRLTRRVLSLSFLLLSAAFLFSAEPVFQDLPDAPSVITEPLPEIPRELFNLGTRKLGAGKLADAELLLQKALEMQSEKVRAPALYNLGHTRFKQGEAQLKKSSAAGPTAEQGRAAAARADNAAARAAEASLSNDVQLMLPAYMNGRGARRELKAATQAIRRALELHGAALRKWQRSLQDFQSAAELKPSDTNAVQNAELVEREIAKLVDSIREMQQAAQSMAQSQQRLQQQMKQLGGRIPEPMLPPGAKGEDDEEEGEGENGEEPPPEPQPGQRQSAGREGEEIKLSPEEAGWLLEGFQLDSDRRLPMGQGESGQPKDRKTGRNW